MPVLLPSLLLILDLVGLGLNLWLGLHLVAHAWGWPRARAWSVALAAWSLALVFAFGAAHDLALVAGSNRVPASLRLLLWPLPLAWLLFAGRLSYGILRARYRLLEWVVALSAVATLAAHFLPAFLRAELLRYEWVYLPFYLLTLLAAVLSAASLAHQSRVVASGTLQRRAMSWLSISSLLLLLGTGLLATGLLLGFSHPLFGPLVAWLFPHELRLAASVGLLCAGFSLSQVVLAQARAEGAPHVSGYAHSLLVTLVMTLFYMTVGALAVWRWDLPITILAVLLVLALLTDLLANATRRLLERWLYRGETGALRNTLRRVADQMEAPDEAPPALRAVLGRLARQLNMPQLGVAVRKETEYRVIAAVHPAWEGKPVDVRNPAIWEERSLGGWNLPLKAKTGETIGVLASDRSRPLSLVQRQLLADTAARIVVMLEEWRLLDQKRASLQKALEVYRSHAESLDREAALLGAPLPVGADLREQVERALTAYSDADALEQNPLTTLKLVARLTPVSKAGVSRRGEVLHELLFHLVEQLRPYEGEPPTESAPEWRPYLILKRVYLDGEPEHEWMIRLRLDERAFRKVREAATGQIARVLAELEAAIRLVPDGQSTSSLSSLSGSSSSYASY
ncbi:MAG: hypothetical protein ACRDIB_00510, partial [Ardenticatenaceae bacterium]